MTAIRQRVVTYPIDLRGIQSPSLSLKPELSRPLTARLFSTSLYLNHVKTTAKPSKQAACTVWVSDLSKLAVRQWRERRQTPDQHRTFLVRLAHQVRPPRHFWCCQLLLKIRNCGLLRARRRTWKDKSSLYHIQRVVEPFVTAKIRLEMISHVIHVVRL